MGRCFSTVYRILLMSASTTALVLSVLSATSCSFVEYDRGYGRELQAGVIDENVTESGASPPPSPASRPSSSPSAVDVGVNASEDAPAALLLGQGSAGLFCEDLRLLDVLWNDSLGQIEKDIADSSHDDRSEESARKGAIVAIAMGASSTLLLIFESWLGWRMCFERCFLGSFFVAACVAQGTTFLFFDSDRYW